MLKEILIPIDGLLLDPNNPRFINEIGEVIRIPEKNFEKLQADTFKRFSKNPATQNADFDVTNIRDLYDSMLRIGFVNIDRIIVMPILNNKYLVIEGNRRVATVKSILRDYASTVKPFDDPRKREESKWIIDSLKNLPAMLFETEGLSKEEIEHKIAILLGIRHHGSVLEWAPLPKAYNIYTEYMGEEPRQPNFEFKNNKAREVANRLCIQTSDVTSALRTYVAHLQLRDRFPDVRDDHFSLIESVVKNRHLTSSGYLTIDQNNFELDEPSLTKLDTICQFSTRDSKKPELTTDNKKKILKDPKACNLLGRLIEKKQRANHQAIIAYAADLIQRLENQDDLEMTLDQALDDLTNFENRTKWVDAVEKLLKKQEEELNVEKYAGEGLDRGRKDELEITLEPLKKIMGL